MDLMIMKNMKAMNGAAISLRLFSLVEVHIIIIIISLFLSPSLSDGLTGGEMK